LNISFDFMSTNFAFSIDRERGVRNHFHIVHDNFEGS
jgi:hypothetical protein